MEDFLDIEAIEMILRAEARECDERNVCWHRSAPRANAGFDGAVCNVEFHQLLIFLIALEMKKKDMARDRCAPLQLDSS